jgi:hypothetical protein
MPAAWSFTDDAVFAKSPGTVMAGMSGCAAEAAVAVPLTSVVASAGMRSNACFIVRVDLPVAGPSGRGGESLAVRTPTARD